MCVYVRMCVHACMFNMWVCACVYMCPEENLPMYHLYVILPCIVHQDHTSSEVGVSSEGVSQPAPPTMGMTDSQGKLVEVDEDKTPGLSSSQSGKMEMNFDDSFGRWRFTSAIIVVACTYVCSYYCMWYVAWATSK